MSKSKHTDHRVALSSRAERAARDPRDISNPDDFPQLGRDVPYRIDPKTGNPAPSWETRVQAYGEHGFYHETKCHSCHKWLSYKMCPGCSSMLRMLRTFDRGCKCRQESLVIYLRCEDHKQFEDPVS